VEKFPEIPSAKFSGHSVRGIDAWRFPRGCHDTDRIPPALELEWCGQRSVPLEGRALRNPWVRLPWPRRFAIRHRPDKNKSRKNRDPRFPSLIRVISGLGGEDTHGKPRGGKFVWQNVLSASR